MDQNVKQCSDFAVYFYQIRWFDIAAFAFKAPKVLEVVEITASYSSPFVCKYCKLYIQQIWERSHPYHGDDGPESEARCRFRNIFLLNTVVWHYRFCFQCSETAKSSQNIGHSPPPPPPHYFANIIIYIYSIFQSDLACIRPRPECVTRYRFRYVFLLNAMVWHYRVCLQGSKSAWSIQVNGLWPPSIRLHIL